MEPKLAKALAKVQKDIPDLRKNATNPHFKNTYITLDSLLKEVRPVLEKHGLILIQPVKGDQLCTILVDVISGQQIESSMTLVLDKQTPQAVGSAVTYARRYTLLSLLGIVADEDDDGEAASKTAKKVVRSSEPSTDDGKSTTGYTDGKYF